MTRREYRHATDPVIVQAAEFAVDELKKLSDTGIYSTLSLKAIRSGATKKADYHDNIYMTIELASPYFKSGKESEVYEIVVMEALDGDRRKSFAIDNFPEMDEDALEMFWIEMVERKRRNRRDIFEKWTAEAKQNMPQTVPTHYKDEL
ncbi:hypothetical protein THRCLA_22040 [Thraustotheca clavata]|uniref:Uncharacterized protein n=1 Tax=Thraustotheca clavata TaxID=74557 RepID=A0A1V9ZD80_9STRA|nr:hypothetical protein THRCLA_22040 [Thraustotheca clavata]